MAAAAEASAGVIDHASAEALLKQEIDIHEFVEPELAGLVLVDEDIDIGIGARLIPRMRTENIKRSHPPLAQRGLGLSQGGDNVVTAHGQAPG